MNTKSDDIRSIEACRPHSDDRDSSEFQPVAERIKNDDKLSKFSAAVNQIDSKIADEIKKVPVPPEFKDRLLASLNSTSVVKPRHTVFGVSPKNWIGLAIGISASAACLVFALAFTTLPTDDRTESDFIAKASDEYENVESWVAFKHATKKQTKLLPKGFSRPTRIGQNTVDSALFFSFRQPSAYLMIVPSNSTAIPSTYPPQPISGTGKNAGRFFGVWKNKGHVYVLAVEGSRSDFDRMNASINRLVFNGTRNSLPHRHNRNT